MWARSLFFLDASIRRVCAPFFFLSPSAGPQGQTTTRQTVRPVDERKNVKVFSPLLPPSWRGGRAARGYAIGHTSTPWGPSPFFPPPPSSSQWRSKGVRPCFQARIVGRPKPPFFFYMGSGVRFPLFFLPFPYAKVSPKPWRFVFAMTGVSFFRHLLEFR